MSIQNAPTTASNNHEPAVASPQGVAPVAGPVHHFTVEQYERMGQTGVLDNEERVELLEGVIIDMNPIGIGHRYVVQETLRELLGLLPAGWDVYVQQPVALATSEPIPDLAVISGRNADFRDRHPGPDDIGLVIEVADTSLAVDREQKTRIYAEAGIPEYWILNLVNCQAEVYREPQSRSGTTDPFYEHRDVVAEDGALLFQLDNQPLGKIEVASLFP